MDKRRHDCRRGRLSVRATFVIETDPTTGEPPFWQASPWSAKKARSEAGSPKDCRPHPHFIDRALLHAVTISRNLIKSVTTKIRKSSPQSEQLTNTVADS